MPGAEIKEPETLRPRQEARAEETRIQPLNTAEEMFPARERMGMRAERELFLSFRIFDARTRLRSEEALERGSRHGPTSWGTPPSAA